VARRHQPRIKPKIRCLIVDEHPIVREGLRSLLTKQSDFEICGEADCLLDALRLVEQTHPDIVTVAISLKNSDGLSLIRRIRDLDPSIRMLVCSLFDDALYAERALHAGAMGYINKHEPTDTIVQAIRQILSGRVYLSHGMSDRLAQRLVGGRDQVRLPIVEILSDRELEVFRMIGEGLTSEQIARKLHIGVKTIETHRRRIKSKLNLENTAQLARNAAQWAMKK